MFFIPRVNVIESDTGFSVEVLGRTGLRYAEGGRAVTAEAELLSGPHGLSLHANTIACWDPPFNTEVIDDAERARIVDNIRAAFRFRGIEIEVSMGMGVFPP